MEERTSQCECLTVTAYEANCFASIKDTLLLPANEFSAWTTLNIQSFYNTLPYFMDFDIQ